MRELIRKTICKKFVKKRKIEVKKNKEKDGNGFGTMK